MERIELPISIVGDPRIEDILNELEDLCEDPQDENLEFIWVLDDEAI